jgi:hypothetical protein
MVRRVVRMALGGVRMMGGFVVVSRLVVLRRLRVMSGGVLVMLGSLAMVFGRVLGHGSLLSS